MRQRRCLNPFSRLRLYCRSRFLGLQSSKSSIQSVYLHLIEEPTSLTGYLVLDPSKADGTGLIGLGPNYGSQVHLSLNTDQGNSVLDRIFLQNTSTSNYLTVKLGRADDPDAQDQLPGEITIGELVTGYDNITSQPKLPVSLVSKGQSTVNQHWQSTYKCFFVVTRLTHNSLQLLWIRTVSPDQTARF